MTKATARFLATLMFLTGLFIAAGLFVAHAEDKYRVVPINAFCHTPDVFFETVNLSKSDGHEMAIGYLNEHFKTKACKQGRFYFLPTGIERRLPEGAEGPEIVLRGQLPDGRTVYVWINESDYDK